MYLRHKLSIFCIAFLGFVSKSDCQTCCVSLAEFNLEVMLTMAISAQSLPNASCAAPLYWTPCISSMCWLVDCTGKVQTYSGTVHAGICGPNTSASTAENILSQLNAVGNCSQRAGIYKNTTIAISSTTASSAQGAGTATSGKSGTSTIYLQQNFAARLLFAVCCFVILMFTY